jgi:hypothetical protein
MTPVIMGTFGDRATLPQAVLFEQLRVLPAPYR